MSPGMDSGMDICVWVHHKEGVLEEETFGLVAEARRLISGSEGKGRVTALALGSDGMEAELSSLEDHGVSRVIFGKGESLNHYHGELFADLLFRLVRKYEPFCILMAQSAETADFSPRLAARLETALVTRAMDLKMDQAGTLRVIRPVANGYLFERLRIDQTGDGPGNAIISFLPSVLSAPEAGPSQTDGREKMEIVIEPIEEQPGNLKTRVVEVIDAVPGDLDLEEADIIVSGGRGVGKGSSFDIIHELADLIGGSVAGTRPVIDWQTLPYERQIGQTGKTVSPSLLINCGISGANEYTAGIEKSKKVIAIDQNPRARIFSFADLGVIGDLHEILPILIERIKDLKES